jgi:hypothetical protein
MTMRTFLVVVACSTSIGLGWRHQILNEESQFFPLQHQRSSANPLGNLLLARHPIAVKGPGAHLVGHQFAAVSSQDNSVAVSRRGILGLATMLPSIALPCSAFDKLPEEKRVTKEERQAAEKKNKQEIQPYLRAIQASTDAEGFAKACDKFSLWLIGKGELPIGLTYKPIVGTLSASYNSLPTFPYRCEKTRTNNGICMEPGPLAKDSYLAALDTLRGPTRSKGPMQGDGVSAAETALF